ncbi:uncharacterized protein LOC133188507 [Saccostrea echinata]|uniref:uncharacterized protein LOC133188507 n=1 Tax=Saccostrea echinata TaxID=191078 RepID=UPI002A8227E7|nr:uncharacterized protein LOC133188507 [Saccostrea echinata]
MHRVNSNCRTLAHLVIIAHKDIPLPSLNKLLSPDHFDKIVKYANELSSEVPSLPEPLPKDGDLDYELAGKEDQSSFTVYQASSSTAYQASSSTVDQASSSTADTPSCSDHEQPSNSDSEQPQYIRSKGCKRRWTDEEEEELLEAFAIQIKKKLNVSTKAIRYAQSKYKTLRCRSEAVIRSKINNIILGKVKKKKEG